MASLQVSSGAKWIGPVMLCLAGGKKPKVMLRLPDQKSHDFQGETFKGPPDARPPIFRGTKGPPQHPPFCRFVVFPQVVAFVWEAGVLPGQAGVSGRSLEVVAWRSGPRTWRFGSARLAGGLGGWAGLGGGN